MIDHKIKPIGLKQLGCREEIICDVCFSNDIVDTKEGYVCKNCGIVLEIQKLEYYRPYNDDIIQHAVLGNTQIGFRRERLRNPNSMRLEKLNQLQSIRDNNQTVLDKARIEISRIFTILNLPDSHKELVFNKFKKIREGLNPGTKYRNPEKLVPIAIYFTLKLQNVSINEKELLEVAKISKKDFNNFKLQILKFVPQYAERNRKDYILQKILGISEQFGLGMPFYYQSKKILYKLWGSVKCTKDDVVAGLVASISILCTFKERVTVNAICKRLGIKMSTIQSQVQKRIFERLNVPGFISLVKSYELLKKVLIHEKILEPDVEESSCEDVEVQEYILGSAERIYNRIRLEEEGKKITSEVLQIELLEKLNNTKEYLYILKDNKGQNLNFKVIYDYRTLTDTFEINIKKIDISDHSKNQLFELICNIPKGPPIFA